MCLIEDGVNKSPYYEFYIQRPGAYHHVWWMSKATYTLNITLLLPQFSSLPWYRKKQLEKMSFYIIFVYLKSWFTAFLLYSAELLIWNSLNGWRSLEKVYNKLAEVGETGDCTAETHLVSYRGYTATMHVLSNSYWDNRRHSYTKISYLLDSDLPLQKPVLPRILPNFSLAHFVEPRSTLLFKILYVLHS